MQQTQAAPRGSFEQRLRHVAESGAQAIIAMADKNFMLSRQEAEDVKGWISRMGDLVQSEALMLANSEASLE